MYGVLSSVRSQVIVTVLMSQASLMERMLACDFSQCAHIHGCFRRDQRGLRHRLVLAIVGKHEALVSIPSRARTQGMLHDRSPSLQISAVRLSLLTKVNILELLVWLFQPLMAVIAATVLWSWPSQTVHLPWGVFSPV